MKIKKFFYRNFLIILGIIYILIFFIFSHILNISLEKTIKITYILLFVNLFKVKDTQIFFSGKFLVIFFPLEILIFMFIKFPILTILSENIKLFNFFYITFILFELIIIQYIFCKKDSYN